METTTSKTIKVTFHGTINNHKSAIDFLDINSSTGERKYCSGEIYRHSGFNSRDKFISNVTMPVSVIGHAEFLINDKTTTLQELYAAYYDKINVSRPIQTISIKHESEDPDNYALSDSDSLHGFIRELIALPEKILRTKNMKFYGGYVHDYIITNELTIVLEHGFCIGGDEVFISYNTPNQNQTYSSLHLYSDKTLSITEDIRLIKTVSFDSKEEKCNDKCKCINSNICFLKTVYSDSKEEKCKCINCKCKTCKIAEYNGGAPGCGNCRDCFNNINMNPVTGCGDYIPSTRYGDSNDISIVDVMKTELATDKNQTRKSTRKPKSKKPSAKVSLTENISLNMNPQKDITEMTNKKLMVYFEMSDGMRAFVCDFPIFYYTNDYSIVINTARDFLRKTYGCIITSRNLSKIGDTILEDVTFNESVNNIYVNYINIRTSDIEKVCYKIC